MSTKDDVEGSRDELWVDYAEGDLERALKDDLEIILQNSPGAKTLLNEIKTVRTAVKVSAFKGAEQDGAFYDKLHDSVMKNLDRAVPDNVAVLPSRRRGPAAAAIALLLIGGAIWKSLSPGLEPAPLAQKNTPQEDLLISTSAKALGTYSNSLISDQLAGDFLIEVAAHKIETTLSKDETAKLFDRLKE